MSDPIIDPGMNKFKMLTEEIVAIYTNAALSSGSVESETPEMLETEEVEHPAINECRDVVFKLKSFMETAGGEYALGVETGMARAAEMIENIIRRHEKGDNIG